MYHSGIWFLINIIELALKVSNDVLYTHSTFMLNSKIVNEIRIFIFIKQDRLKEFAPLTFFVNNNYVYYIIAEIFFF